MSEGDTPSLREQLQDLTSAVQRIESALIGDEKMGNNGLVRRVATVEEVVKQHDRKLLVWGAVISAGLFVLNFLKEKIFHL